jgi:MFS family permease
LTASRPESTPPSHPAESSDQRTVSGLSTRRMLAPLALTQFIASFAGSNMNVAINSISEDLDTTVHGVQTAITLFLLCMAALMIPGSKLTDRWGRKRCLTGGLTIYGAGALIGAIAPGLGVLILGYSLFEGVGSALMIPRSTSWRRCSSATSRRVPGRSA